MHKKSFYTIAVFASFILLFSACIGSTDNKTKDRRGAQFAGSESCKTCHAAVYSSYQHAAHGHASAPTNSQLLGHQLTGKLSFSLDDSTTLSVEKRGSQFYQVAYRNDIEKAAQTFDVVFGSGEKAQTYAYWKDKQLYELPLSFYTSKKEGVMSPGFPSNTARFERMIEGRCLECHASFVERKLVQNGALSQTEEFEKASILYGIDCERCHGPAADHVNFHTEHPEEKRGRKIATWASLSRQQKLDACAVCHSGSNQSMQRSTFAFQPGDTLSHFIYPDFGGSQTSKLDVHGQQSQMLASSACFRLSQTLECSSCHNTHTVERNNLLLFSQRCATCHNSEGHSVCKMTASLGQAITANCIDCHMPKQASNNIVFALAGKAETESYYLRNHRIAVYPEETRKFLARDSLNRKL